MTRAMLHELGHRGARRQAAAAPRSIFFNVSPGIELLIVDFAMPGMNGAEVARRAQCGGRIYRSCS